jgi:peroxiredoxin Q/BCP
MRRVLARSTVTAVLEPGTPAPPFALSDQDGTTVSLADLRGRWVLLWWYPKASTPG